MTERKSLTYVEIDIKYCSEISGVGPCTSTSTGDDKCFNTRNKTHDCRDPANFNAGTKTLRFGLHDRPLPPEIHCYPFLESVSVKGGEVQPGESLGKRSTVTARFINAQDSDSGLDKYISDRTYNPFDQGTFWGKFRARNTYLEARPMRVYRGYEGDALADMDCENFVVETMVGPDSKGNVTIQGVDFVKLLNTEKAQAPVANNGYLSAALNTTATSVTLLPSGIGDDEYPNGIQTTKAVIGQEEVLITNRSGDVFTITRAQGGTAAQDHDDGEVVQLLLEYESENAAVIANDLIVNYSPLDSSYTDVAAWEETVTSFADVLYSRKIVKPTPVKDLLNELIHQAGLIMFGDTRQQKITFDVLRPNPVTGLAIGSDEILQGSFSQSDQPSKRFSQVWVFYGKKNVFESDEPANFYSAVKYPVADDQYETPNIKKIYSKWIPSTARSVATDVAARAVARYKFPPRKLMFSLYADNVRNLGQVIDLEDPSIENALGAPAQIQSIITGWTPGNYENKYQAEEYNIDAESFEGDKIIQIDFDTYNVNLRSLYDSLYSSVDESTSAPDIIFIISSGVVVGSTSPSVHAIETGSWPSGVEPLLQINSGAYVVGRGGGGGLTSGGFGGPALEVTSAIRVDNSGTIGGGGGGGGGQEYFSGFCKYNRGGGGAGWDPGIGHNNGTLTAGGAGLSDANGAGGDGGDLGQDGGDPTSSPGPCGTISNGGPAGNAIDGVSLITFINTGTILGAQVG